MYTLSRALLFLLPAELAHHVGFTLLRWFTRLPLIGRWLARYCQATDSRLRVDALGLRFPSPIGLAAGFDKDAVGYDALAALGFSFVEVGTVTGEPQPGNPKPRLFRLPADRAIINRMGFNNRGAEAMRGRLVGPRRTIVGVNIGKTKLVPTERAASDYDKSARLLAPLADYMVINVSSPNTPGLRDLQAVESLRPLLLSVRGAMDAVCERRVPLLVKIAPDLGDEDVDAVADLALEVGLDGIIATNTTVARTGLSSSEQVVSALGAGGLSGAPLKRRSLEVLRRLRRRLGARLVLISVGGVEDAADVWERLRAGANLVQLYTGFVYGGPLTVRRVHAELSRRLDEAGLDSIAALSHGAPSGDAVLSRHAAPSDDAERVGVRS